MTKTCWMCGALASSKEHRLKKADIQRFYGRGPYRGDESPVHFCSGTQTVIQGPDSKSLKYDAFLCHQCNTARTQPFDKAYDQLISWVFAHEEKVLQSRLIDFEEVYGAEFPAQQTNLYKYFAKSFGCRLTDAGYGVPKDIIELFPLPTFRTALRITFSVNEDIYNLMQKSWRDGFIGKGELLFYASPDAPEVHTGYVWNEHVSWFTVHIWYDVQPWPKLGATWVADSQCVYLGSNFPLTDDQRSEYSKLILGSHANDSSEQ